MMYDHALHVRWSEKVEFGRFDECWIWKAASIASKKSPHYRWGVCRAWGKAMKASRVGWLLLKGEIPDGTDLLHTCDNPMCVNPGHLFPGTQADNVADMDAKHRRRTVAVEGARHHNSKLTSEQVSAIRKSRRPTRELVALYGANQSTIDDIKAGRTRRNG